MKTRIFYFDVRLFSYLLASMLLIACANDDSSNDPAKLKLSGTWDIHGISTNPVNQDFVITHQQVGISELNNQVVIDNCLNNRDRTFTRDKNYLINEAGEKLRIVDEHTIESISVPDIRLLYKSSSEHFHDAGSVTLQSNTLLTINAVSQVSFEITPGEVVGFINCLAASDEKRM